MSDHEHHGPSLETYFRIFATLIVMTVVTVAVSRFDLGTFNTPVALGIAGFKASIVLLFFMHVYYEIRLTAVGIGLAIVFLSVMIGFILTDELTRIPVFIPIR